MPTVIDADTGLILREGSEAFGGFHEWTEPDTAADPPQVPLPPAATGRYRVKRPKRSRNARAPSRRSGTARRR